MALAISSLGGSIIERILVHLMSDSKQAEWQAWRTKEPLMLSRSCQQRG